MPNDQRTNRAQPAPASTRGAPNCPVVLSGGDVCSLNSRSFAAVICVCVLCVRDNCV